MKILRYLLVLKSQVRYLPTVFRWDPIIYGQYIIIELFPPLDRVASASQVSYSFIENSESTVYLEFKNVPMAQMGEVEGVLMRVLKDIVSGLSHENTDGIKEEEEKIR